jgi:hypothetical protein
MFNYCKQRKEREAWAAAHETIKARHRLDDYNTHLLALKKDTAYHMALTDGFARCSEHYWYEAEKFLRACSLKEFNSRMEVSKSHATKHPK